MAKILQGKVKWLVLVVVLVVLLVTLLSLNDSTAPTLLRLFSIIPIPSLMLAPAC